MKEETKWKYLAIGLLAFMHISATIMATLTDGIAVGMSITMIFFVIEFFLWIMKKEFDKAVKE